MEYEKEIRKLVDVKRQKKKIKGNDKSLKELSYNSFGILNRINEKSLLFLKSSLFVLEVLLNAVEWIKDCGF